jgi:hypothetical protein
MWTKAYNQSGFANAEKRLFGTGNNEFWNHPRHFGQPPNMVYGYPGSKGFPSRQTKSGVQLWPPSLLTKRIRVPLVHSTDESPNPHQHAVHLLKDHYPSDPQELHQGVETRWQWPLYLWGLLQTSSVRLESAPPPSKLVAAKSIWQRMWQRVVVLHLANDCRAHLLLP